MSSDFNLDYIVSYAQNREDILLGGFLKNVDDGFYVDVGANHPIHDSVTYLFYRRGWHGINIEPIKDLFDQLESVRPRDINLNIGISDNNGKLKLRHYKNQNGLSTFSDKMKSYYEGTDIIDSDSVVEEEVDVKTLSDVLKEYHPKDIHFLKIDVEGFEREVIVGNNWKKYRPWILCIEANNIINPWEDVLEKNNYKQIFHDGLNKYFIAVERAEILDGFSYPETMFAKQILTFDFDQSLQVIARDYQKIKANAVKFNAQYAQMERDLAQSRRIKGSIKQLLRAVDNAISVRIDNLDRPKSKKIKDNIILDEKMPLGVLLNKIRAYDFERYYSKRSSSRLSYEIVKNTYHVSTRYPLKLARKAKLVVRKIKNIS